MPGGILAADESVGTMGKRLEALGLPNTFELRNAWRKVMFGATITPYVNGVILFEEQLENQQLVKMILDQGALAGIKIDKGLAPFEGSEVDEVTQGTEDADERLARYKSLNASFTKFRSFLHIRTAEGFPSEGCIRANAKVQAEFALASQKAGLVPMVEPEVDMAGEHSIEDCKNVTEKVLKIVFEALSEVDVFLPGVVLKPNMILSGSKAQNRASAQEVARATIDVLQSVVPSEVTVIPFLSGGQSDAEAYANLDAINKLAQKEGVFAKRRFTYSFGRAAQDTARAVWAGKDENIEASREKFVALLKEMSDASMGTYSS